MLVLPQNGIVSLTHFGDESAEGPPLHMKATEATTMEAQKVEQERVRLCFATMRSAISGATGINYAMRSADVIHLSSSRACG